MRRQNHQLIFKIRPYTVVKSWLKVIATPDAHAAPPDAHAARLIFLIGIRIALVVHQQKKGELRVLFSFTPFYYIRSTHSYTLWFVSLICFSLYYTWYFAYTLSQVCSSAIVHHKKTKVPSALNITKAIHSNVPLILSKYTLVSVLHTVALRGSLHVLWGGYLDPALEPFDSVLRPVQAPGQVLVPPDFVLMVHLENVELRQLFAVIRQSFLLR